MDLRTWPILLVVVVAAACSPGPQPSAPAISDASAAPSGSASPAASDAGGVIELELTGQPLPPGRYTRTGFEPPITIELNGDWQAVQDGSGFFDVQQRVGSPDVIAVQFANVTGVWGDGGTAAVPDDHGHAARILGENPDLLIVESSESRIGGLTGSQVTVDTRGELSASVITVPPGTLQIDPGRRLWIAFFDTDAGLLAIMVGGSVAEWQAALDAAEPVLESIEIGE